ncbi:aspartate/tyrosine/aromatic aminotransferase [Alphaproteobacteria bacterium KMM 3653]|uniref:Aspartate/tyrosine/aromatic aminotransferase n=1 Tax=Harenicola maris TaxID=2841044 RepID=A0AAP2G517_9RHOB|nr:aspartate/tyrosine/aromatic aminotransferase [Harenicola maris]
MFENIQSRGVDQILAMMQTFKADARETKVDLIVGVYKDAKGDVPVMRAVKEAERRLIEAEDTKTYVGISGDPVFRGQVPALLLGAGSPVIAQERVASLQTVGGSGALRVGCDLLNAVMPAQKIWVSTPTWANHVPIATDAGLTVDTYPYFRPSDRGLDFEAMMAHLEAHSKAGEILLLHACCHNPTGVDMSLEQWQIVTDFVVERGLIPYVDCAYQGLGNGMEEDAAGLRIMAEKVPEMVLASSFSKNFGIYRERTGALSVIAKTPEDLTKTLKAAETLIRSNYSMPPSHGARIVATVFDDADLTADWRSELDEMRVRIAEVRQELRAKLEARQVTQDLAFLTDQNGMFSYTGFNPEQVTKLREDHGIYTAGDGRINVAGLTPENLDAVADGFAAVLR